jgi:pimeloyl-ACP methyl ester carboxylesterase
MDGNRRVAQFLRPVVPLVFRSPVLRRIGFGAAVERFDLLDADTAVAAALDQADAVGFHAAHDGMIGLRFDRSDDIDHDVPVTIVFGAADRIIPAGTAREREHTPIHSRWITLPRCGHVPMWDAPEETVRIVRETARV